MLRKRSLSLLSLTFVREGRNIAIIVRRFLRPLSIFIALWCLYLTFRSDYVTLIPGYDNAVKIPTKQSSRIGKASVAVNTLNNTIIHQAFRTHQVQNEIHGYIHHIATNEIVGDLSEKDVQHRPRGAWSKPAYLLSLIVNELMKPEEQRLEWLFWFDADTMVLNPYTPLEVFLPPDSNDELSNVNLLLASNWDGLNSGVFAMRIHPWTVSMLSAILAYPVYRAEKLKTDRFRDQSAFQWFLQAKDSPLAETPMAGKENWAEVPMRWFNSLPVNNAFTKRLDWVFAHNMTRELFDNGTDNVSPDVKGGKINPWKVMQGDMVVHFAGSMNVRDSWMGPWLERAEARLPEWANVTKQGTLRMEAAIFWGVTAKDRVRARAWALEKIKKEKEHPSKTLRASTKTTTLSKASEKAGKQAEEPAAKASEVAHKAVEPPPAKVSEDRHKLVESSPAKSYDGKKAAETLEKSESTNTGSGERPTKFKS